MEQVDWIREGEHGLDLQEGMDMSSLCNVGMQTAGPSILICNFRIVCHSKFSRLFVNVNVVVSSCLYHISSFLLTQIGLWAVCLYILRRHI
uniref:Uncharacterized protein n=1 Tax=Arundo donax TaxID=35708 RepID=A0A0A9ELY8_ARUDO